MFLPLNKSEIAEVVRLQMNAVKTMLASQGFTLEMTERAVETLADAGYDPEFGARPVKRAIQHEVLNELSKRLLAGDVQSDKPVIIDAENGELTFRN